MSFMQDAYGTNVMLFGADYVWPRRTFEIAKPIIAENGGTVVSELYLPLIADDFSELVAQVRDTQPDYLFVLYPAVWGAAAKALDDAGITYKLTGNGTAISVSQGDLGRARLALSAAGVTDDKSMPGYKVLDSQGLTVSDFKQQVDYKRAIEGELANTLMAMDGVDTARVILSLPEKALFKDDQDQPRASVLIGGRAGLDSAAVRAMIRPVSTLPVSETIATFGWRTSASPAVSPCPVTTLSTPAGRMSAVISASRSAVNGVSSEGLSTTVFPAASAGPSFQVAMLSG